MSGFEIAGAVLGAFPLLVTALEHYHDCARVLDDWWSYSRRFQKCRNNVDFLRLDFSFLLRQMLSSLVCDETHVEALIANPNTPLWQDPNLEATLKDQLKGIYIYYQQIIEEINEIMQKLKHELGYDDRVTLKAASVPAQHYKRIRFALGRSTRDELFKEFEKQNDKLRRLLQISNFMGEAKTTRRSMNRGSSTKALKIARKRASTLYELIANAWSCGCKASHRANLRLQERKVPTTVSCTRFEIAFQYSMDDCEDAKPWSNRDISIVIVEKETFESEMGQGPVPDPAVLQLPLQPIQRNPLSPVLFQKTKSSLKKLKKVVWTESEPSQSSIPLTSTKMETIRGTDCLKNSVSQTQPSEAHNIADLCAALARTVPNTSTCCGILTDDNEDYQIFPNPSASLVGNLVQVPLKVLLDGTVKTKLSVRERIEFATVIASSNAQFWATPWLPDSLAKDSIYFLHEQDYEQSYSPNKLCLTKNFAGKGRQTHRNTKADNDRRLTSLGILLLELCYRRTLESFVTQTWPDIKYVPSDTFDHAAALLWSKGVNDDMGPSYASAVEWCLQKGQAAILSEDEWYLKVYENVVIPLQECCAVWD